MADLVLAGARPFFQVGAEQDARDATQVIGGIDQGGLGMPDRDYYLKDDEKTVHVRDAYLAHVERVFALLGDTAAQAKEEAAAVLALESDLAKAQISRVEHRDPEKVYHKVDRAGLALTAPAFDWDVLWKELGRPDVTAINVAVPPYVMAAFSALAAPPAKWLGPFKSYLRWQYVMPYQRVLSRKFVDEYFAFDKALTGAAAIEPRWKRCVRAVDVGLGEALAIPFVQASLGDDGKATTKAMVKEIEAAMEEDLQSLSWMDDATRAKAEAKVHKLFNKIGYPDTWRNYDALVPKIKRRSYVSNVVEAGRFELVRELAEIGKPVDRAEWHMTPPTVNAYYNAHLNEMVFPAGILQPPFYAKAAPVAVNFGGIGMVEGHELTHGFDDRGRKFDGDGNLTDWWTPTVAAAFEKRAACVSDQFDGYVAIDDLHLNGKLTLGENLADLGGAKLALAVLHAREPVSVEADRQFFFGISQVWCGAMRPEMARVRVRTDPHSPPRYRVDGPLSNMPEFARAFSCQPGDAMVRPEEKRCSVW
jgi:endothelin-converting enzyme/putative endopeptidase